MDTLHLHLKMNEDNSRMDPSVHSGILTLEVVNLNPSHSWQSKHTKETLYVKIERIVHDKKSDKKEKAPLEKVSTSVSSSSSMDDGKLEFCSTTFVETINVILYSSEGEKKKGKKLDSVQTEINLRRIKSPLYVQFVKKNDKYCTCDIGVLFKPTIHRYYEIEIFFGDFDVFRAVTSTIKTDEVSEPYSIELAQNLCELYKNLDTVEPLMQMLIEEHLAATTDPILFLREPSFTTLLLNEYLFNEGLPFIKKALKLVLTFAGSPEYIGTIQLDPSIAKHNPKELKNLQQAVFYVVESVLNGINDSVTLLTPGICNLLKFVEEKVANQFTNGAVKYALSTILFLRFICPAIVAPERCKIFKESETTGLPIQRFLVMVAKVIQQIANGELFGLENESMQVFNSFIPKGKAQVEKFMKSITKLSLPSIPTSSAVSVRLCENLRKIVIDKQNLLRPILSVKHIELMDCIVTRDPISSLTPNNSAPQTPKSSPILLSNSEELARLTAFD